ncbi:MAG: hypothetical protein HYX27_09295 [Acidobacteria bacterium]|nr:hypothetical protein [Acidobacteriota bacterium]
MVKGERSGRQRDWMRAVNFERTANGYTARAGNREISGSILFERDPGYLIRP